MADFVQGGAITMGSCSRCQIELISKYHKETWELIAKEQGGVQWIENYREETPGLKGYSG